LVDCWKFWCQYNKLPPRNSYEASVAKVKSIMNTALVLWAKETITRILRVKYWQYINVYVLIPIITTLLRLIYIWNTPSRMPKCWYICRIRNKNNFHSVEVHYMAPNWNVTYEASAAPFWVLCTLLLWWACVFSVGFITDCDEQWMKQTRSCGFCIYSDGNFGSDTRIVMNLQVLQQRIFESDVNYEVPKISERWLNISLSECHHCTIFF
jgi:hypothetical protein